VKTIDHPLCAQRGSREARGDLENVAEALHNPPPSLCSAAPFARKGGEFSLDFLPNPPFNSLHPFIPEAWLHKKTWPTLEEFNQILEKRPIYSATGAKIKALPQTIKSKIFEEGYEPRIYLNGELQTRLESWHDFFNFMVWQTFPNIKAVMNKWQYLSLKKRFPTPSNRTHLENLLTQLDEGGMIVLSANQYLTDLLKKHEWKKLFWENREAVKREMRFYIIGHAIYEKLMTPYPTITAGGIIFDVEKTFFEKNIASQIRWIDSHCANFMNNDTWSQAFKRWQAVPIFGIPSWSSENNQESYYENTQYFRPLKNHSVVIPAWIAGIQVPGKVK